MPRCLLIGLLCVALSGLPATSVALATVTASAPAECCCCGTPPDDCSRPQAGPSGGCGCAMSPAAPLPLTPPTPAAPTAPTDEPSRVIATLPASAYLPAAGDHPGPGRLAQVARSDPSAATILPLRC